MNRNKRCQNPFTPFWIQVMFSVFRGTKYDDIRPNHTKKKPKQPKTNTPGFLFFMDRTKKFLVHHLHRPNGAKILRFRNFPETMTYPESLENCQKSKSFSKIWLWKSWTFGYFSDRTRKPPHFQYIWAVMTMMGGMCGRKNGQTSIWYRSRQCVVSLVRLRSLLAS